MIEATFNPVFEDGILVKKVLIITFNGKFVNSLDYPPGAEMSQDEIDNYLAQKFSGILS